METNNIVDFASRDGITDALTQMLRTGAQQLIATAVEAELEGYMAQFAALRTRQQVMRQLFATGITLNGLSKQASGQ